MSGFITMQRDALDHHLIGKDPARFYAWFWMVAEACWRDTKFDINGKTIDVLRGQFVASRARLADAWGWSPSAVERFLTRLETEQMIGRDTGQGRSIITIRNYEKYNPSSDGTGQATGQATGQRPDSDRTTKEQGNKGTIEPNGSNTPPTPQKPKPPAKVAMTDDWQPGPLPASVAALVAKWPPGRVQREIEQFRDYWLDRNEKRPGWDRTFHNRIRDIHDRVLRDASYDRTNDQANRSPAAGNRGQRDRRDSFTRAIDDSLGLAGPDDVAGEDRRRDDGVVEGDFDGGPAHARLLR